MLGKSCFLLMIIMCFSCAGPTSDRQTKEDEGGPLIDQLISNLENSKNDQVIVVAHRGDWRNAPENSLQAIQNCIDMGVDMIEIDVRMTRDSVLVLMHDETIDRTTTGSGAVQDFTYDSLQTFFLRDGLRHATPHKVPTLEEALMVSKDKILVNLDKSYNIFVIKFFIFIN